jgi:type IV pilus assembly protein PilV
MPLIARHAPSVRRLARLRVARESGSSLIEVLVSVVILAVGLLGLGALQLRSMQLSTIALGRSIATSHAIVISERMRANRAGMALEAYDNVNSAFTATCFSTGCTPAQMAANDVAVWREGVASALPAGRATVCRDSSPGDGDTTNAACDWAATAPYRIKIFWADGRGGAESRFITTYSR